MTDYVLDTIALAKYLEDDLPRRAARSVREAEHGGGTLYLPEIVLGEFLYLALRGRLRAENPTALADEIVDRIQRTSYLAVSSLPAAAWNTFLRLGIPELHDRMIAASALFRGVELISNDPAFRGIPGLRVVW